jgi:hypothetical protein
MKFKVNSSHGMFVAMIWTTHKSIFADKGET